MKRRTGLIISVTIIWGTLLAAASVVATTFASGNGTIPEIAVNDPTADISSAPQERVVQITARNFEFNPNTITVKKGEPVVIELSSLDRKHGFSLRAFGVRTDVKPGGDSRVRFTPDKTGKFSFSCDVFCGDGHEEMVGTLIVTD
jgi:cytochrome c oxidase subunit 2